MTKYQKWINNNIHGDTTGRCEELCSKMLDAFPELTRVRGHVHITRGDIRTWPHWWLKSPEGEIVDPSADQFPPPRFYEEWDESRPEPTGKCPNCGGYSFNGSECCSDECFQSYVSYLNASIRGM